jgi:hypothetical protein
MKLREWQGYLDEQRRLHGKVLFTATELSHFAGSPLHALNVELARLKERRVIVRYARGIYGPPRGVTAGQVMRAIDSRAYITSAAALSHHGLITQTPALYACFTDRRHNRSRLRMTPLGQFLFVCVKKPVYHPAEGQVIAPPEQALFDFVYLMRRKGVDPTSTVTFRRLETLRKSVMKHIGNRYPAAVRKHVLRIIAGR